MYQNIHTCVTVKQNGDLVTYAFASRNEAMEFINSLSSDEFLVHKPDSPIETGLNVRKAFYTIFSISLCGAMVLLGTVIVRNVQEIISFQVTTNCTK